MSAVHAARRPVGYNRQIHEIWEDVLGHARFGPHDHFFHVGGTSLAAIRMIERINGAFGTRVGLAEFFAAPTITGLIILLRENPGAGDSLLMPLQQGKESSPIYFMPTMGGHVCPYYPLLKAIGPQRTVYGFQSPGLSETTVPAASVVDVAQQFVSKISLEDTAQIDLVGYSMGGQTAIECARLLRQRTLPVRVTLIDAAARLEPPTDPHMSVAAWILRPQHALDETAGLNRTEAIEWIHRQAITTGTVDAGFSRERIARMFNIMVANQQAALEYKPQPYDGHVLMFSADGTDLGWKEYLPNLDIQRIPANHADIVAVGATAIATILSETSAGWKGR